MRSTAPERSPERPHLVALDPDHPGFRDAGYRARRDAIARHALRHDPGDPAPTIAYTTAEHATWSAVSAALEPLWVDRLHPALLECTRSLALPRTRVPQLEEVNARLGRDAPIAYAPVAGLVEAPAFLERLARGVFLSTQYVRHPSRPLYTPEPDVIHEVLGHAPGFAHPALANLQLAFGRAAERARSRGDTERLVQIERTYWWTIEFGLAREGARVHVVGAGLASSVGELQQLDAGPRLLPLDLDRAAATAYDPTAMQGLLFVAESLGDLCARTRAWLEADAGTARGDVR